MHHRSNVWRRYPYNMDSPFQSLSFCRLSSNSSGYKMLHFVVTLSAEYVSLCTCFLTTNLNRTLWVIHYSQASQCQEVHVTCMLSDFVIQHRLIAATSRVSSNCDWSKFRFCHTHPAFWDFYGKYNKDMYFRHCDFHSVGYLVCSHVRFLTRTILSTDRLKTS